MVFAQKPKIASPFYLGYKRRWNQVYEQHTSNGRRRLSIEINKNFQIQKFRLKICKLPQMDDFAIFRRSSNQRFGVQPYPNMRILLSNDNAFDRQQRNRVIHKDSQAADPITSILNENQILRNFSPKFRYVYTRDFAKWS